MPSSNEEVPRCTELVRYTPRIDWRQQHRQAQLLRALECVAATNERPTYRQLASTFNALAGTRLTPASLRHAVGTYRRWWWLSLAVAWEHQSRLYISGLRLDDPCPSAGVTDEAASNSTSSSGASTVGSHIAEEAARVLSDAVSTSVKELATAGKEAAVTVANASKEAAAVFAGAGKEAAAVFAGAGKEAAAVFAGAGKDAVTAVAGIGKEAVLAVATTITESLVESVKVVASTTEKVADILKAMVLIIVSGLVASVVLLGLMMVAIMYMKYMK